jgi:hypothetical protein
MALFNAFGPGAVVKKAKVVFQASESGLVPRKFTLRRRWVPAEKFYGVVVDRSFEEEEMGESMINVPFGPLSLGIENIDIDDGIKQFAQD